MVQRHLWFVACCFWLVPASAHAGDASSDPWKGIVFGPADYQFVVRKVVDVWIGGDVHHEHIWRVASQFALRVAEPKAELVPEAFLRSQQGEPRNHGRYDGSTQPFECDGAPVTDLLIHQIPPDSLAYQVPAAQTRTDAAWVAERDGQREQAWASFVADPEWKKVREESEKDGPLLHHLENRFLSPTSYSPLS